MDRGITPSGVCPRLSAVKSFYRFLLRRGLVETDPAHMVQAPKKAKVLPYFIKEKDMNRLLDDVRFPDTYEGRRNRLIVMMLYSTGIRASELVGIDLDDVNMDDCTIRVTGKRRKQRVIPFGIDAVIEAVVGDGCHGDAGSEDASALCHGHECHEAAIAPSPDADAVFVHVG